MSIAIGDVYKIVMRGKSGYGDDLNMVFHYSPFVGMISTDPLQALIDDFEAQIETELPSLYSIVIVADTLSTRTLVPPIEGREKAINWPGLLTGDPLPQQIATQILWKTAFLGRRYQGHTKVWYPNEAALSAGTWGSGHLANGATAAASLIELHDALTGLVPTWGLVVFSVANQTAERVTSFNVTRDPRSQLSRTIARGT